MSCLHLIHAGYIRARELIIKFRVSIVSVRARVFSESPISNCIALVLI